MGVVWYLALTLVATAATWKGSTLLEHSSDRLAAHYGLSPVVKGAIVSAVGSSFPELTSVVLAVLLHGQFELGVGVIVGSAVFNVLVVPALSGHAISERVPANREIVFKEALFYMLAVAVTVVVFAFARIYHPVAGQPRYGTLTRDLALLPVGLYVLYTAIQYVESGNEPIPEHVDVDVRRTWATLLGSLVLIAVAIEGLVRAAIGLGTLLGTPSFLWGLTVIAAATSLPDVVVSVRSTRDGGGVASLANALGSNTFDLLVAMPVGILLAGATRVFFGAAIPLFGFLTVATVALFSVLRSGLSLSNREASALLGLYGVFVAWLVAETLALLDVVPGV